VTGELVDGLLAHNDCIDGTDDVNVNRVVDRTAVVVVLGGNAGDDVGRAAARWHVSNFVGQTSSYHSLVLGMGTARSQCSRLAYNSACCQCTGLAHFH
jgi:hypothetical protein